MVSIDEWHPATVGQSHHDAGSGIGRDVVDVRGIDPRVFEPAREGRGLDSNEIVSSAQLTGNTNVEPEPEHVVILVSGSTVRADHRASGTVIVMGQSELSHSMLQ